MCTLSERIEATCSMNSSLPSLILHVCSSLQIRPRESSKQVDSRHRKSLEWVPFSEGDDERQQRAAGPSDREMPRLIRREVMKCSFLPL